MTTCIVTLMRGRDYENEIGSRLTKNKQAFCDACGYRCMLFNTTSFSTNRSAHWDKLLILNMTLQTCNISMWVDADVVFRRPFAVAPLLTTAIGAARDVGGLNSGVMFFMQSEQSAALLIGAWHQEQFSHTVWEQSALRQTLKDNPVLQPHVTIYENIVRYPTFTPPYARVPGHGGRAAPLYHIAGCFLLTRKLITCHKWLDAELAQANMSTSCSPASTDAIGPRLLKRKDMVVGGPRARSRAGRNSTLPTGRRLARDTTSLLLLSEPAYDH